MKKRIHDDIQYRFIDGRHFCKDVLESFADRISERISRLAEGQ